MAITSEKTSRIVVRGETANFKVSFFSDDAMTQPLIPVNPNFPKYVIYDLTGVAVQSGSGTLLSSGQYTASFLVPKDAKLSYFDQKPQQYNDKGQGLDLTANNSGRYRIEWQMLTEENYQVNFVEEFDVKDIAVTRSESRELKYLAMAGKNVTVSYRTTELPIKAKMEMFLRGQEQNPEASATLDRTSGTDVGNLKYAKDGDSYVLYFDIPAGVTKCNTGYIVLWTLQDTVFSTEVYEYQILTSISHSLFPWMTSLRMLIDKFQVRLGRLQAYEDSDLLEYLSQGLRMVNMSYPTTSYQMANVPDDVMGLVLYAAGWHGLKAQSLLNAQLNFSFTGQQVTLSVDNASQMDSVAQSLMDTFNQQITPVKMSHVRRERGIGTVGTRGVGYARPHNMVFRVGTGNTPNSMNWLTRIGLL